MEMSSTYTKSSSSQQQQQQQQHLAPDSPPPYFPPSVAEQVASSTAITGTQRTVFVTTSSRPAQVSSPAVIVTQVTTPAPLRFGPGPVHMTCPYCSASIVTVVEANPGTCAYLTGTVCCLFGCWLGCCLIPCCIDDMKDKHHVCPNCRAHLGRYNKFM